MRHRGPVPLVTAPVLPVGGGLPPWGEPPADVASAHVDRVLRSWLDPAAHPRARPALPLAQAIADEVRAVGLRQLPAARLAELDRLRARHRGRDLLLDDLLDGVLAAADGRYWNRTYLVLPVLERLVDGPLAPLRPLAVAALLVADVVRLELLAARTGGTVGELGRPDPRTLRTRVGHAIRFVAATMGPEVTADLVGAAAREPEAGVEAVVAQLPVPPAPWVRDWLAVTVLPVSTVHDERFFIRALQAHEMVFTAASRRVAAATRALRDGDAAEATRRLRQVTELVDRGQSLFRMVATIRTAAFFAFRDRTEGASAIQSEQYKRFELRCGTPPPRRAGSAAFARVPSVTAEAARGVDTVVDAYLAARRAAPDDPALGGVAAAMRALELSHGRWKATHVALAARVLGEARGSGYTAGVPYLREWLDHPLFGDVPAIAAGMRGVRR